MARIEDGAVEFTSTVAVDGTLSVGQTANAAQLDVLQPTLGSIIQQLSSEATGDNPLEQVVQNKVLTTNATVTTLHTFTISASTTYYIRAIVIARRTGGASGAAEDGAAYFVEGAYKNVAGAATFLGGAGNNSTFESQVAWDCALSTSGATVLLRVTGAAGNNISWAMTARVYAVSS